MAQFDVHRNANPDTADAYPYLVDLQHEVIERLATRVVAPMVRLDAAPKPISRLNPRFFIEDDELLLSVQELAGVESQALGDRVISVADRRGEIIDALDLLFTGI